MRLTTLLLAVWSLSTAWAAKVSTDFTFSTPKSTNRKLRRQGVHRQTAVAPTNNVKQVQGNARDLAEEDVGFWNRVLDEEMSVVTPRPTDAPVAAPVGPPPATPAPSPCPVIIDVDCVSVDGSQQCTDIQPPASGTGDGCIVEVEYSYTFTNVGNEVERIYSLRITRGGDVIDFTDRFPITDIQPGESTIIIQNDEIDICQGGSDAFATEAAFVTGPPCDVEVTIACVSEEGDECRQLPQANNPSECLIDITYTYTVTNIGDVDANIILFTRTRNGDFVDLIGLLPSTFLAVSEDTFVTETEEIDRCVQQSFATNTIVAQIPNADLLCEDVGFYP